MPEKGGKITRRFDKELRKLMTQEELEIFYDSNEFQRIRWDDEEE